MKKIKKSTLKEFVKKVIKEVIEQSAEWTVDDDELYIERLTLTDGRVVDAILYLDGAWDDGAFDYEYGMQKGTHRYDYQYTLEEYWITSLKEAETGKVIWKIHYQPGEKRPVDNLKKIDPIANDEIMQFVNSIEGEVESYVNNNPPEKEEDPRY